MMTHILMIDTLEKQALYSLQDSLQSIGSLMALQTRQLPMIQLGLCGVIRSTPKDVKLQMLSPPQPLDLRQWYFAVHKLSTVLSGTSIDSFKTAAALQTLVDFLAANAAAASCSGKTVTIVGQAFQHVDAYASVLKFAAQKGIHISFVAIAHSQVDGEPPTTEVDLADFTTGLADFENASASYCPCDPFAIHQVCLRWLHSILDPRPVVVTLHLPRPAFIPQAPDTSTPSPPPSKALANPPAKAKPHTALSPQNRASLLPLPDQASFQQQSDPRPQLLLSLVCRVVSEVAELSPVLVHPSMCPCHGAPVQQSSTDARQQFCGCSVSAACFRASELKRNRSVVQIGSSTTLSMPPALPLNLQVDPGALTSGSAVSDPGSELHVSKRIKVDQLSESLLFGWPNILIPHANSFDSSQEMQANEQGLAGLCQVLEEQQEVLLLKGCLDLDNMQTTSWPLHYVARPACNGCSMLIRRVACHEELLPVGHLLAGQTPDVPLHVKQGLQDVLQAVPVSDYSPLDHHSGAFQKLAGLVSQSLPQSSTPPRSCKAPATAQAVFPASGGPAPSAAPLKLKELKMRHPVQSDLPPVNTLALPAAALNPRLQPAHAHQGYPQAQQVLKSYVQLPPAPKFSLPMGSASKPSQQDKQQSAQRLPLNGSMQQRSEQHAKPVSKAAPLQMNPHFRLPVQLAKQALQADETNVGRQGQGKQARTGLLPAAQTGPRLNFKRIRTLK